MKQNTPLVRRHARPADRPHRPRDLAERPVLPQPRRDPIIAERHLGVGVQQRFAEGLDPPDPRFLRRLMAEGGL